MDDQTCNTIVRPESCTDPAEWCEEEALPGSEFCRCHDPDARDDDLIAAAESAREPW